jgi:membrane fusion protein (multidrug efflux system)
MSDKEHISNATESSPEEAESLPAPATEAKSPVAKRFILIPLLGIAVVFAGLYGYRAWKFSSAHISTDDAYVTTDVIPVSSRVIGNVAQICVKENQFVHKGELLVLLDDATFRSDVRKAEADVAVAKAAAEGAGVDVSVMSQTTYAQVEQAQGTVQQSQSEIAAARTGVRQMTAAASSAQAQLAMAQATANASKDNIEVFMAAQRRAQDQEKSALAQVATAEASVRTARSNLVSAQATARSAAKDAERARSLEADGAMSNQELENWKTRAATSKAAEDAVRHQIEAAEAEVTQRKADAAAAASAVKQAQKAVEQSRMQALASGKSVDAERAKLKEAQLGIAASQDSVKSAEAKLAQSRGHLQETFAAPKRVSSTQSAHDVALARVLQAQAALDSTKIALSRTHIYAPIDGVISRKSVQLGQQIAVGQPLMAVIPKQTPWIIANFKETQLPNILPGQKVEIEVDAMPDFHFQGVVDSISRGTGATFALLPPDNATGNFTKVVQRVPVKIVLQPDQSHLDKLRAGLSVTVHVQR